MFLMPARFNLRAEASAIWYSSNPRRRMGHWSYGDHSRMPDDCATLAAVSLLAELDAFFTDHMRCGELDAGVEGAGRVKRLRLRREHGRAS